MTAINQGRVWLGALVGGIVWWLWSAGVNTKVLAGAYAAAGCGSMAILRFADTPGLGVIHLAALSGGGAGVGLEAAEDVARYIRAFARLRAAALTPAASARLLREMARD